MNKEERTARLRDIMAKRDLSASDIGKLLTRSPQTVRSWACAYVQRAIPPHMLDLLQTKLGMSEAGNREQN